MMGLIFVFVLGCFLSCKDDPVKPPTPEIFSLRIVVKDTAGQPVTGLRINGGNLITTDSYSSDRLITSGAYVLKTIAQHPENRSILYHDSIYMMKIDQDISTNFVGYTSSDGSITIEDPNLFPSVLGLTSIPLTKDNPSIIGKLSVLDSVQFVLRDSSNHSSTTSIFYGVLKPGKNEFSFIWGPTSYSSIAKSNTAASFAPFPSELKQDNDSLWNKIIISDSVGRQKELYLARADLVSNPNHYELPPLPPPCSFDVRFSTGHSLRTYPLYLVPDSIYQYRIKILSCAYPLTFKWNFVDQPAPFELTSCLGEIQIGTYSLLDSGTIKLNDRTLDCLIIKLIAKNKLPQNYPNPFTNITTVRFAVNQPSYIIMKVCKLTGEVISTLIDNEYFPPGYHTKQYQPNILK
ncbi:MAG: hypothetical protein QME52_02125 [Bacteroidota bacterium]|nr:hypothetical protein [Bacteroidota bacterium]